MIGAASRRLIAGVLGAGLALLGAAPAAQAATPNDTSVSVGRLVLEPTDRGYAGSLPVTVTYRGAQAAHLDLAVTEPVLGAFVDLTPSDACVHGAERPVRTIYCVVPGGALQPGERRQFAVKFRVLTTPRSDAMNATGGRVSVETGDANPGNDVRSFTTLFRSTTGSLRNPRPYVWDTETDASLTVGSATLARESDGSWFGRLPVTVRSAGDAPHDTYFLEAVLPAGVSIAGVEPDGMCGGNVCEVSGGRFMEGEQRQAWLLLRAPAEIAPGDLGTGSVRLYALFGWGDGPADVDPADNTVSFGVTASELT